MLDVKTWLETTGLPVKELRFLSPPALPYVIFRDSISFGGADIVNNLATHELNIELYSENIDTVSEGKIEALLTKEFTKDREWIESERFYQTIYETTIKERI